MLSIGWILTQLYHTATLRAFDTSTLYLSATLPKTTPHTWTTSIPSRLFSRISGWKSQTWLKTSHIARSACGFLLKQTLAGEYNNEYVWNMEFNKSGEKIVGWKEFIDVGVARDFLPKLRKEMQKENEKQMGENDYN
jgi:hypothetical protein